MERTAVMPKLRTYICPSCSGKFEVYHHITTEPPPRFCSLCGYDCKPEEELGLELSMPHLAKPIGKIGDQTYRGMEEGAAFRAQVAQEVHGLDADQAAMLKITDMRDNNKVGEDSVVDVVNSVSQQMAMLQSRGAPVGFGGDGIGFSQSVSTGPHPNAGARTQQMVRQMHGTLSAQVTGFRAADMSNVPALETRQPGYRNRV